MASKFSPAVSSNFSPAVASNFSSAMASKFSLAMASKFSPAMASKFSLVMASKFSPAMAPKFSPAMAPPIKIATASGCKLTPAVAPLILVKRKPLPVICMSSLDSRNPNPNPNTSGKLSNLIGNLRKDFVNNVIGIVISSILILLVSKVLGKWTWLVECVKNSESFTDNSKKLTELVGVYWVGREALVYLIEKSKAKPPFTVIPPLNPFMVFYYCEKEKKKVGLGDCWRVWVRLSEDEKKVYIDCSYNLWKSHIEFLEILEFQRRELQGDDADAEK